MTRPEARAIADKLCPQGFKFDSLDLFEHNGEWRAIFCDDNDPPRVVIERWDDYYTAGDPEPTDEDVETDANESANGRDDESEHQPELQQEGTPTTGNES